MKIRNGYVSNSSSSSFLVCYKSVKDFSKFDKFDGCGIFKGDLKHAKSTDEKEFYDRYYDRYGSRWWDGLVFDLYRLWKNFQDFWKSLKKKP